MELDELLAELAKHPAEDVVKALKEKAKSVYQVAFNDGHAVATGALSADKQKLDKTVKELTESKGALEKQLKAAQDANPELSKVHDDYRKQIEMKDKEIQNLQKQHTTEKLTGVKNTARGKLLALVAAKVTDNDLAEAKVNKAESRIQVDENDLSFRVLQPGQSIPFAGDQDAQLKALAEEIIGGVDPKLVRSDVPRGTGRETPTGGTGGSTETQKKAFFDGIREKAKASVPSTSGETPAEALNKRFGKS